MKAASPKQYVENKKAGSNERACLLFVWDRTTMILRFLAPADETNDVIGAGDGDRTHAASLGSWNSAIELHPRILLLENIGL
jgi:hypothetical protein